MTGKSDKSRGRFRTNELNNMTTTTKQTAEKATGDKKAAPKKKADGTPDKRTVAKSTKVKADSGEEKKPTAKKSSAKKADNYTDPELREKVKNEIMEGDKGGKPGQWSARKAQLLSHEYEKQGGDYKDEKKTGSQKSLSEWSDQDWKTSDGKPADREGGTTRYLPKEAWDKLSEKEKKETNVKKVAGSKAGRQNVPNTAKAKKAKESAKA